ncbi:MAG: class I SAM-dependent methyltransferase [Planctomycetota bacterium]
MNRASRNTIRYYDEHAAEYARKSASFEMASLYRPFLELIPDGGRILDAGCGSGRDTRAFMDRGYDVVAFDGSKEMTQQAERLIGEPVQQCLFQEMRFENEFDGVWCCAALLHVPRVEIVGILDRFIRALHDNGVCYVSFNEGDGERINKDRHFTDLAVHDLTDLISATGQAEVIHTWQSEDYRFSRNVSWVNALFRKS